MLGLRWIGVRITQRHRRQAALPLGERGKFKGMKPGWAFSL